MNDPLMETFGSYKPELGDSGKYMAELERKLEAVELVERELKKEKSRARAFVAAAFILGTALGGTAIWLYTAFPVDIQTPDITTWIMDNMHRILRVVCICALMGSIATGYLFKEDVI